MKRLIVTGIMMTLIGCASVKQGAEAKTVVLYRTPDVEEVCSKLGDRGGLACCVVNDKVCTIIIHPQDSDNIWGHELRHCFDGAWHEIAKFR